MDERHRSVYRARRMADHEVPYKGDFPKVHDEAADSPRYRAAAAELGTGTNPSHPRAAVAGATSPGV